MRPALLHQAENLIKRTGSRPTRARVMVLAVLSSQRSAVTHHQIERALGSHEKIDRVTLYRVLEWLTAKGLAHKVLSGDRAWHFHVNEHVSIHHEHAHFKCNRCEKVVCLDEIKLGRSLSLPRGYRAQEIDMTVKGLCASCA